jgi:hypothetical protein
VASPDPQRVYAERLAERRAAAAGLARDDARLARARGLIFVVFVIACVLAWRETWPAWTAGVPALAFLVLVVVHERVDRARRRAARAIEHYAEGLERLADRWAGRGPSGLGSVGEDHPYAADLDLFGAGSLFDRLCRARTRGGEALLARWLAEPFADLDDPAALLPIVHARQASVRALSERVTLREDLALLGAQMRAELHPEALLAWARAPGPAPALLRAWSLARVLAPPSALLGVLAWSQGFGPWWLAVHALAIGLLQRASKHALARLAGPLDRSALELGLLADSMARLELEVVEDARLVELHARLAGGSQAIARLRATIGWFEAQYSSLFAPIAALLAWGPGFGLAIERWRTTQGPRVAAWLAALSEWEALASLAAYAFENPADPFPTLVEREAGPRLIGDALAHPLLPRALAVANPVSLGAGGRACAYVISGSNMSGKSTFLRTVGCNVVLALAGAPVRAASLELSPLRIGATLRIQDSLAAGRSRFAAELLRLRAIDELAERGPLLFLLDEIFHGTNSHDRRIGAEALLRSLVERGAIGLLTTHDLALARTVDALQSLAIPAVPGVAPPIPAVPGVAPPIPAVPGVAPPIPATPGVAPPIPAINMHFRDELDAEAGALRFDHRIREGVVDRSNALALMRAVGLRV